MWTLPSPTSRFIDPGSVAPADYEATRDAVIDALLRWRLPGGGAVVARALRREQVHDGPFVERAPDVVVELALDDGYGLSLVPTPWQERPRCPPLRTLAASDAGGGRGRGMNGTHRPEGIWIDAHASLDAPPASLADAAPAIAGAMGLEWERAAAADGAEPGARRDYSEEEDARVAQRLRALGYLE